MMTVEQIVRAETLNNGVEQDLVQRAAMDRELRPLVSGLYPARFAPDRLSMLGEVRQFLRPDAGGIELLEQAEFDQFAHCMRQHIDADAKRLQFRHAFKHAARNTDLVKAQCERQPADPAPRDKNRHDKLL